MNFFGVLDLSSSALEAERLRAEVVATNLANAETTHTARGGPYTRQLVVFGPQRLHHMSFAEAFDRFSRLHAGVSRWSAWFWIRCRPFAGANLEILTLMRRVTSIIRILILSRSWRI